MAALATIAPAALVSAILAVAGLRRFLLCCAAVVLLSLASLPMLAVDVAVSIWGIAAGLAGRRIGWTTEHRG